VPRLCERPGCGEKASVGYGFDAERGTVWLDALGPSGPTAGVLCRRHAEAMVVPNGWWLQDRRDSASLFSSPAPVAPVSHTYRPKRSRRRPSEPAPLPLDPATTVVEPVPSVPAWTPAFDAADDLGGLLDAKTPLLSRAFGQGAKAASPTPKS
jgi:hypothetical protein